MVKDKTSDSMDFDQAIHLTGYGKFHLEAFTACAICISSVGFQNGLSAYIFPAAQCELDLTSFQLSLLNVCFLVGGALSSFLWGVLADAKGRRKILIVTHLLNAAITIICATNPLVFSIIVCRFLNGFLIGAPGSIIFSYLAEFQPPKYRSAIICYSGIFFTSSWLLLPLLAWLILPIDISIAVGSFIKITSWRIFLMVLIIPEIVAGFWFMRLPESPKFFVAKGNQRKALAVLRKMFVVNTGRSAKDFPVKSIIREVRVETFEDNLRCRGKTVKNLQEMFGQFKSLFRLPLVFLTLLTTSIMFTNMFGTFGLGWWLPELFVRFERFQALNPNSTITVKQLALFSTIKPTSCKPSFESAVIRSTIIMGVSSILTNAFSGWLATRVSLRTIPFGTMLIGGISASLIYWLTASWQNLVVASIFQSAMVTANMTIGSVVVELFPTSVGAMAICLTMCAGRIGAMASNVIFGLLMDQHCEIPIFVVAASVLIGAGICYFIPPKREHKGGCAELEIAVVSNFDTKL
ncbi:synaptic vesicle glycoprotein 2C-like [Tribolium madens]|uniref:synaptic vesicle glycoprotein 2C-like n=1 Tax=Tribolium madens TaxID=41895 RepID=UPI001CF7266F|nr:synaptic vesicle glycoprotein 2C-like [Tribolium madens]